MRSNNAYRPLRARSARQYAPLLIGMSLLTACVAPTPRTTAPISNAPTNNTPPVDVAAIPDAIPTREPLSKLGNPSFYDVLGKRYFVLPTAAGYVERGVASWYGPGFHQENTSNGEPYDMYGMTAAHKTLPLPCFVQVTNLSNGKTIVVRVNDRGPFKDGRIIDLSYTAAAKLDMLRAGTALVEVRAITAEGKPADSSNQDNLPTRTLYVQAGAFSSQANADRLASQLRNQGYAQTQVRGDDLNGRHLYRVRIGPVADVDHFDRIVAELKQIGINDARLASD